MYLLTAKSEKSEILSCRPKEQWDSLRHHLVCLLLMWSLLLWTTVAILPLPHPGPPPSPIFPQAAMVSAWAFRPGLSPTSPSAIQLCSGQGLLQMHLSPRSQKSPPTWHAPCGETWPCGYLKSASWSLCTQFGQPPPPSSPALDLAQKRPPLRSCSWFSSQIFRQGLYTFKNSRLEKESLNWPLQGPSALTVLSFKICLSPPCPPLPCDQFMGWNGLSLTPDLNTTILFRSDLCSWHTSSHLSVCVSTSFSLTKTKTKIAS